MGKYSDFLSIPIGIFIFDYFPGWAKRIAQ